MHAARTSYHWLCFVCVVKCLIMDVLEQTFAKGLWKTDVPD